VFSFHPGDNIFIKDDMLTLKPSNPDVRKITLIFLVITISWHIFFFLTHSLIPYFLMDKLKNSAIVIEYNRQYLTGVLFSYSQLVNVFMVNLD